MTIDRNAQQRIHQLETEMRELKQCIRDLIGVLNAGCTQVSVSVIVEDHEHYLFDNVSRDRLSDILMKLG